MGAFRAEIRLQRVSSQIEIGYQTFFALNPTLQKDFGQTIFFIFMKLAVFKTICCYQGYFHGYKTLIKFSSFSRGYFSILDAFSLLFSVSLFSIYLLRSIRQHLVRSAQIPQGHSRATCPNWGRKLRFSITQQGDLAAGARIFLWPRMGPILKVTGAALVDKLGALFILPHELIPPVRRAKIDNECIYDSCARSHIISCLI